MFSVAPEIPSNRPARAESPRFSASDDRAPPSGGFATLIDVAPANSNAGERSGAADRRESRQNVGSASQSGRDKQRDVQANTDPRSDQTTADSPNSNSDAPSSSRVSDPDNAGKSSEHHTSGSTTNTSDGQTSTSTNDAASQADSTIAGVAASPAPPAVVATTIAVAVALVGAPTAPTPAAPPSTSSTAPLAIAAAAIAASTEAATASTPGDSGSPASAATTGGSAAMTEAVAAAANDITVTNFQIAKAIETNPAPAAKPNVATIAEIQADPQAASMAAAATVGPAHIDTKLSAATRRNDSAATAVAAKSDDAATSVQPATPQDVAAAPAAPATSTGDAAAATKSVGGDGSSGTAAEAAATPLNKHHFTDAPSPSQPGAPDTASLNANAATLPQVQPTTTAPVAAAQVPATPTANLAVPLNGLAVQIATSAQGGKSRFEIRLDPAELGRIDVRLDVDRHGQVTSHLTVEKPETLAMLRQDAPQLQRALEDAGLKTGNNGLQFSLRDQSSSGNNNGGNGAERQPQRLIISDANSAPAVAAGRTYHAAGSSRGIDIRV